ncbi:NmrA family NAD(P)-binding protein [Mesorhizobium yinganensis]|uniref:NmrA family NAD(P)-binding protein n=1 Tax=Mesorhizobium yinganensis TaxID=3157707 RepID=UPI0032B7257D
MSSITDTRPILVTGATGKQGGATIRALLQAGRPVRALTRNPESPAAQALADQGVEIFKGDMSDSAALDAALAGAGGLFSMQMGSSPFDPETEIVTGKALIEAAGRAGVDTVVHTSVARAGDQKNFVVGMKGAGSHCTGTTRRL